MKVKLEERYREFYTIEDLDAAKRVIAVERQDDEETPEGWAGYAAREAMRNCSGYVKRIIEASARTAKNMRVWNEYGEETKDLDVWIEALAETSEGFLKIGAYLSDIWQTGAEEYKHRMYIERYTLKEQPKQTAHAGRLSGQDGNLSADDGKPTQKTARKGNYERKTI